MKYCRLHTYFIAIHIANMAVCYYIIFIIIRILQAHNLCVTLP